MPQLIVLVTPSILIGDSRRRQPPCMDYSGLAAFLLLWLYVTVCLATRLLSNKSDIGEAAFGRRPTLVAYLQQQVGRRMDV